MAKEIDAKELANDITIEVVIIRYNQWLIRWNIGIWLLKLAAWIMWVDIEITEKPEYWSYCPRCELVEEKNGRCPYCGYKF